MKLGLILVLVALLVPTVLWLVRGDGWDIVVREGYTSGKNLRNVAIGLGHDPNRFDRAPTLLPLRYLLATARSRHTQPQNDAEAQ